ncbi:outer membrane protein assembly factor BamA [Gangjinia marincola]|uniref:Outer membrane protein assembly factor BamA n=1 Tax=Gangjinia marincola TaxID=578463 RepID=A0ABP3XQ63_9FLAO
MIACVLINTVSFAQEKDLSIADGKKYTIGEISVTGSNNYNEKTVIAFTGLKQGQEIYFPGVELSKVINKLWDLGLFSDINIYINSVEGNTANIEIEIVEVPELAEVRVQGIKKKKGEEVIENNKLLKGAKVTENLIATTRSNILSTNREKGYFNTKVIINTIPVKDTISKNRVNMVVNIDKGDRVKIDDIEITGNEKFSDARVKRQMKNTKEKFLPRFWKRSKYIESEYEEDKEAIITKYKEVGYRDARIVSDSLVIKDENSIALKIDLEEGDRYYFGDIDFIGNSVYSDQQLKSILSIKKGDIYNGTLLQKRIADPTKPDGLDITNLYNNNGYLTARVNPVETKIYNDTIDFEIRIVEGKEFYFDHVEVLGNDRTNDHVIYRNLRTKPGQKYSKDLIIRSVRELGQTGFFDPELLAPDLKNVDQNNGTVDLEYVVSEQGSSRIELQGGFGAGGFVGTLGLAFSNFSLKGIFDKDAYKPLPMGDGQTMSLRAQASNFFQTYSLSFVEPWLGGKKPISFSTSFSHTVQFQFNNLTRDIDRDSKFTITGINVGLGKQLQIPDDFFSVSGAIGFQQYNLENFSTRLFQFPNGYSNNLTFTIGLRRSNKGVNPIFPTRGSEFNITAKFTPPWSSFDDTDYGALAAEREALLDEDVIDTDRLAEIDQERFRWLEYYKIKFNADWYNTLVGDLVLRTNTEFGFLGAYNNDRGEIPFERFFLGGAALGARTLDGRENIQLRGYEDNSLFPESRVGDASAGTDGATIYNKFSLELRYPITLKPAASIWAQAFAEGGATFDNFRDFNPFGVNRSAGAGLRIFMQAFGLIGIDFGYGFDPAPGQVGPNGWETHFIIGQQF